jgi:energy-coupling factor transporter ATP-binding protein EcfA2
VCACASFPRGFACLSARSLSQDEPTNYLDNDTLAALTKALQEYKGGVIAISHNAPFVEAVCNERWTVRDSAHASVGSLSRRAVRSCPESSPGERDARGRMLPLAAASDCLTLRCAVPLASRACVLTPFPPPRTLHRSLRAGGQWRGRVRVLQGEALQGLL